MRTARRRWTKPEMDVLRRDYGRTPARQIAESLGRTVDAIHRRAWEWSIGMPPENRAMLTSVGMRDQ